MANKAVKVKTDHESGPEYPITSAQAPVFMPDYDIEDAELPEVVEVRSIIREENETIYDSDGGNHLVHKAKKQGGFLHLDVVRTTKDPKSGIPADKPFHERVKMPFRSDKIGLVRHNRFDKKDIVRAIYALEGRGTSFEIIPIGAAQLREEKRLGKELRMGVKPTKADMEDSFEPSVIDDGRPTLLTPRSHHMGVGKGDVPVQPMAMA